MKYYLKDKFEDVQKYIIPILVSIIGTFLFTETYYIKKYHHDSFQNRNSTDTLFKGDSAYVVKKTVIEIYEHNIEDEFPEPKGKH